jgi:hypothetical protein
VKRNKREISEVLTVLKVTVFWVANVSEKHAVFIFSPEDGDSILFPETLVSAYESTRRHNPEE